MDVRKRVVHRVSRLGRSETSFKNTLSEEMIHDAVSTPANGRSNTKFVLHGMFEHSLRQRLKAHRLGSRKHDNYPDDARHRVVEVALALHCEQTTGGALDEDVHQRRTPRTSDRRRKRQAGGGSKSGSGTPKVRGGSRKGDINLGALLVRLDEGGTGRRGQISA